MFACYIYVQTLTLTPSPLLRTCVMINWRFLIRRRTFHQPNLIHWIKHMKSSASELIRNACFNLEQLNRSSCPSQAGILTLDRLWNGFWFRSRTFHVPNASCINYYNIFSKQFNRNEYFSPFELSSAEIKIGVWINSASLNYLGRPYM